MQQGEVKYDKYKLPNGKEVQARYKCHKRGGELYWEAYPQNDDLVFVINKGGIPKPNGRNPYAVYDRYYGKDDGIPVAELRRILAEDPESMNKDRPDRANDTAEDDLEWDGGSKTGVARDTRKDVTIPLFGKPTRTYLVIGKVIKP